MKENVKRKIFCCGLCLAVGGAAAWISRDGFRRYGELAIKPRLSPPAWVFPVVWTALYILMGLSAQRIFFESDGRRRNLGKNLFIVQLILNFFWTLIFFRAGAYGGALVCLVALWMAVAGMVWAFCGVDAVAAAMQIPYLLWTTFALYLNFAVWQRNG